MNHLFQCCLTLLLGCSIAALPQARENPAPPPTVILKLDDLKYQQGGPVHPAWQQVFDYLNERKVTATIGVIANSLEEGDGAYFDWINGQRNLGHEIWNHGYCHCKPTGPGGEELREFRGPDYNYQLVHLERAQKLAVETLGFPFRSFGAPHNATDSLTTVAMASLPGLKVWMYKDTDFPTDKYLLERIEGVNIEYPVHVPDFAKFKAGYLANSDAPVLIIQGHPQSWYQDAERMGEFKKIVEFLVSEGVEFTTPYDYFISQQ